MAKKILPPQGRVVEGALAVAAFATAAGLSFTALLISDEHEITAGNLTAVAQFLLFAASVLGIDYKFHTLWQSRG